MRTRVHTCGDGEGLSTQVRLVSTCLQYPHTAKPFRTFGGVVVNIKIFNMFESFS